jgi:glycosyltransferase involved in cell wall biosynthesis
MQHSAPPRVLINGSNLHVGGAVAVATSVIEQLSRMSTLGADISLLVSSSVHANLLAMKTDLSRFVRCDVADFFGVEAMWHGLDEHFIDQDLVFTLFGPAYFLRKRTRHVFGFAQPMIIYPGSPVEKRMPFADWLRQRSKSLLQEVFFARADELVVELEHVQVGLLKRRLLRHLPTHVVYSAVDSIYSQPDRWLPLAIPTQERRLKLGIIARNYLHKNLACLPEVQELLATRHGMDVDFFVTFPDHEWAACSERFGRQIVNVGPLKLAQCPTFYAAMDGVFFPSLLECFSAVPIEAMMMKRPLFASELPFIRDCCREHAHYFDPLSVESMAAAVAAYFGLDEATRSDGLARAHAFVQGYPGPRERAASYLAIVLKALGAPAPATC